eukprot:2725766-Prorocentrum_lima.AAC.1
MGGTQVEDISNYNRWYECLHLFQPKGKRLNDVIEGLNLITTPASTAESTQTTSPTTEYEPMSLAA